MRSTNAIAVYKTTPTAGFVTKERYVRNEEQWLMGYEKSDSGTVQSLSHFVYDHTGTRMLKGGLTPAAVATNGQSGSLSLTLDPYTIYVNPYYVVENYSNADKISKHYYMGMQRIATNLGNVPILPEPESLGKTQNNNSPLVENLVSVLSAFGWQEGTSYSKEVLVATPAIESYYDIPSDSSTSNKFLEDPGPAPSARMWFFYHPDYCENGAKRKCPVNIFCEHSGRRPVVYITDLDGLPYGTSRPQRLDQYFWYSPWGEALKDQKTTTHAWESPYAFNGKELDEETGLYYYGARYYNPQVSVWLSVDPLAHKYPSYSSYVFTANNPVMLVDMDGRQWGDPKDPSKKSGDVEKANQAMNTFIENEKSYNKAVTELTSQISTMESTIGFDSESKEYKKLLDKKNLAEIGAAQMKNGQIELSAMEKSADYFTFTPNRNKSVDVLKIQIEQNSDGTKTFFIPYSTNLFAIKGTRAHE